MTGWPLALLLLLCFASGVLSTWVALTRGLGDPDPLPPRLQPTPPTTEPDADDWDWPEWTGAA